jgi:Flp pilus assembly protein TadG
MSIMAKGTVGRFGKAEDGAVAIIFSLTAILITLVTGLAIDFGRAYHVDTKVGSALDSAALAAAKGLRLDNLNDGEVAALARRYFDENMAYTAGNYADISSFNVLIDRAQSSVEIRATASVRTMFWGIAGRDTIELPKSSVAIFAAKDIEVGLQLDVTGSMHGQKIADLKSATKDLVDILLPDEPTGQKVRIGYAPFSAAVNAGSYARAVNGNRVSNGCVYERLASASEFTDAAPIGTAALKIKSDLPAPPRGGSPQNCPNATVLAMTDDKALLKSTVDSYSDGGSTAGQLGTAWAWYLISPNWGGVWPAASQPAPYNDGKTIKVAILMTDGIYNTISGVNWGDNSPQATLASQKAHDMCSAMKAEGIIVYTVGFQLGGDVLPSETLSGCASDTSKFFPAENGTDLRVAFHNIAEQITTLRLSR